MILTCDMWYEHSDVNMRLHLITSITTGNAICYSGKSCQKREKSWKF